MVFLVGDVEGRGGKEEESLGQELRVCRKGTSTVVLGQGRERKGKGKGFQIALANPGSIEDCLWTFG